MEGYLRPEVHTVGVTGTNGKTTTTTLVAAALARVASPVARITTIGFFHERPDGADEIRDVDKTHGGFLQVLRRAEEAGGRYAAVEYTSEALSNGYAKLWPPDVAVFTNLTHDHLDAHGSAEHYLASKAQLFMEVRPDGAAVLNGCDAASALLAEIIPAGRRVLRYGVPSRGQAIEALDVEATRVTLSWAGTSIAVKSTIAGVPSALSTRAIGDVFAENALAAFLAALASGVAPDVAAAAIAAAPPPPGRFQVVCDRPWVIVDYAHSPDALARTLGAARVLTAGRLAVVFGAGGERDRQKRAPMGEAASIADRVYLTTDNPRAEDPKAIARAVRAGVRATLVEEPDRALAIGRAIHDAAPDDVIVIAGKGHETTQLVKGATIVFDDVAVATRAHGER